MGSGQGGFGGNFGDSGVEWAGRDVEQGDHPH